MLRRLISVLLLVVALDAYAQQVVVNKQRHFPKTVPAGNYSGICWLGGDRYAVVDVQRQRRTSKKGRIVSRIGTTVR